MHRYEFYHGQTVTDEELDSAFDDCENAELAAVIDGGYSQVLAAATPGPSIYGGVLNGLTVTGSNPNDYVTVAAGRARDYLGRRINLSTSATVKLTNTGVSTVGDTIDATGDAGAITGSCPAGQYIIASLFIDYAEILSNPKTDATGATIQYDIAESFQFDIQIGTSFVHPPAATPTRAALADGKVLLADILLTNNAGTMAIVDATSVHTTDPEWCTRGGNYANLQGRRASWLVETTVDQFAIADADEDIVRANNAREACFALAKKVRSQAFIVHRLTAVPALFSMRKLYGHPARPNEFFDDMFYNLDEIDFVNNHMGSWTLGTDAPGGLSAGNNEVIMGIPAGGFDSSTISILTDAANHYTTMYTYPLWNAGAAPWAIGMVRFKIPAAFAADTSVVFGFGPAGGLPNSALVYILGGTATIEVIGNGGVPGVAVSLGAIANDTWYTVRLVCVNPSLVLAQKDNGAFVSAATNGVDTLLAGTYMFNITVSPLGAARAAMLVDQAYISNAQLSSDMA